MAEPTQNNYSPVIQQYIKIHSEVPDAILFFRMGDFYEVFFDDARLCADLLGITLTTRNKNDPDPIPMAGVPYHSAEGYVARLIEHGRQVAICEQIGDPATSKGPVDRKIVRVVTPGTAIDDAALDAGHQPWLWAWLPEAAGQVHLAVVDFQSGQRWCGSFSEVEAIERVLVGPVAELVAPSGVELPAALGDIPVRRLTEIVRSASKGFPDAQRDALGLIECYLQETQHLDLNHLGEPRAMVATGRFALDARSIRNLELFRNALDGTRKGTLWSVLGTTATRMGARVLQSEIRFPLCDVAMIDERLDAVSELQDYHDVNRALFEILRGTPDLDRSSARLSQATAGPGDLAAIRDALQSALQVADHMRPLIAPLFTGLVEDLRSGAAIAELLAGRIAETPPRVVRDGGVFADGVDLRLDELRALAGGGARELADIEQRERQALGLTSLKVSYNKVFGYYIEISKAYKNEVPAHYHRKQTLTNAERYITEELKTLEERILGARDEALACEERLWRELIAEIRPDVPVLQRVAGALGHLDMFCTLAGIARDRRWVRPDVHDGVELKITAGRHPVLETEPQFVPNDTYLHGERRVLLITGPNMGGKSTYMRQTALIVLLAQVGSFVPAESAFIGLVDQIFTRVGAADALWRGQSTFMVEMTETADLLRRSTERSLVILDEIGRGTSTFDGMSLAQAVVEVLRDDRRARVLFATHFHELAELGGQAGVENVHAAVRMWQGRVVFLHQILSGAASDSYGIEVAKLAGIDGTVLDRARTLLQQRETLEPNTSGPGSQSTKPQLSLFDTGEAPVIRRLRQIELEQTTPLQALQLLAELKSVAEKLT